MTSAQGLADYFAEALGEGFECLGYVANLDAFPPGQLAAVVVDAPTLEPASNAMGAYVLSFPVFVVVDAGSPETNAERLEDVLPQVFAAIDSSDALLWTDAKPGMYDPGKPSYTITITATTAKG